MHAHIHTYTDKDVIYFLTCGCLQLWTWHKHLYASEMSSLEHNFTIKTRMVFSIMLDGLIEMLRCQYVE